MSEVERSWVGIMVAGGRYHLISKLGSGAMGSVYRATDHHLDTEVAVKIPLEAMLKDPDFAPRFDREIRALVKLRHPHIVKLYDVGIEDGFPFMIMEYYRGGDLDDRRAKRSNGSRGPVSPASLAAWLPEIAGALDYAHAKGYIHRDIKPTNILFDEANHAYLADFGVVGAMANTPAASAAAMTAVGLVVGTPDYMAPEIILGEPFDGRADQYSLAVMVYELLAGRRPFRGSPIALIVQHSTQAAPSIRDLAPHVSESLAGVIHRTLDKNPASRFESCAAFAREIVMHAAGIELRESALVVTPETRSVPCPGCGTLLKLLGKYAGKRLRCPTCKITLRVLDDLSLQSFDEPGSLGTMKMNPGTPPSLAVAGTPPEGTTRDPIDTAIIGFATFGIVFVAFLIYLLSSSQKPPEAEIHPPPDIPSKVVQLKPAPQPAEEKRPSRMRLPDGVLVSETFETADIEEGKLPEGWQGDLMVVKKPQDGRMELSLANDQEAGSVTLPFPRDSKVFADFECRVRFLLRENTGKISVNKGKASYLTFSLTNSPGLDHDLFFEVGSTRDFGIIKVFQRPSDSEETAHEMVDPFPMDRASEFVLKRNSDQYEVSINGQIVKKLKFPKYNGPFEHANLALKRPVPEIRPHIVSVSVRAEREPSKRDIAKVSPPRPPFEGTGKSRPNAPAAAPVLAEGFRVDFAGGLMENWESGSLGELKRYSVRKDDKALALAEPGLDLASPFIDHKLDPPITGDFRLKFDLKLPNVASSVAIRLRSGTGALVRIEIQGDDTFSLIAGKESVDNKPMNDVKARNRNGFELQRQGGRFKLSVGGISLANLPSQIGAVSLDGIGVKLSTEYQVVLSPLLYSLDLQPSNP